MRGVRRIVPLTLGWTERPKADSVLGADPAERLLVPVPAALLEVDGGWLLLDTGLNPVLVRDPPLAARFYAMPTKVVLPDKRSDPLLAALQSAGVPIEAVRAVALSHLNHEHAGGLRHFAGRGIPIYLQRRELDYALYAPHPEPERNGMFRIDYDDPRIGWHLVDGDVELMPGVTAVLTAGRSPGHQSFVIDFEGGGGVVLAFDAAELQENVDDEKPGGIAVGMPPEVTIEPILRLKAIAAAKGYRLIPGHDPLGWPAFADEMRDLVFGLRVYG